MKKKIIGLLLSFFSIVITICVPIAYNYNQYFSRNAYYNTRKTVGYNDIFYNPKSKLCEMYSIGGFGHIDLSEMSNRPELIEHYKKNNIKMFDAETIDKFNVLMQQCSFIPVEREKAFWMSLFIDKRDYITYSNLSSGYWINDDSIGLFSLDVINEINEQLEGICEFTLFEKDNKLYLFGAYANEMIGASWLRYERPNFGDTLAVVYEIEQSNASKEIVENRELFHPEKDIQYAPHSVNWILLMGEFIVFLLLLMSRSIRGRFSVLPDDGTMIDKK